MNPSVAHFTDVFYTDRGVFGAPKDTGSVNIHANLGTSPQPGCSSLSDVHGNSNYLYVEVLFGIFHPFFNISRDLVTYMLTYYVHVTR